MNKEIKSIAYTLIILLVYWWASKGIVKLFFNTNDKRKFDNQVKFLNYCFVLFSLVYLIGIYHIVGPFHTAGFYKAFIIFNLIYLVIGNIFNSFINFNFKN